MAKKAKKKVRHLIVFLLKPDVTVFKDALKDANTLTTRTLRDNLPFGGEFYFRPQQSHPPSWLALVRTGLKQDLKLTNQGTAAVLFLKSAGRLFALTFGYGRSLLRPDAFERNFGLKVALNTVDSKTLKSVDSRTFEDLTLVTRRQASRGSEFAAFGLDVTHDVLRAVTGTPKDATFARRITGADALVLSAEADFQDLGSVCKRALDASKRTDYKADFAFIDHIQPLNDPSLKSKLEAALLDAIHSGSTDQMHLAPPEPLDWEKVDGFLYSTQGNNTPHLDLDFAEYLGTTGDVKSLTLADLKKDRISALIGGSTQAQEQWTILDSIVFETDIGGSRYVLSTGDWFKIAKSFAKNVAKRLKGVPNSTLKLPNATAGEKEGDYNSRVAGSKGYALLDQKNVRARDANSDIEVCDLFTSTRQFVHVKRKTRSATLSHLFAQGLVSAEAFHWDEDFRKGAKSEVAAVRPTLARLIPNGRPKPPDFEIVYAIVTRMPANRWPSGLPFFSQLNLVNAADRLVRYGFNVSLLRIAES